MFATLDGIYEEMKHGEGYMGKAMNQERKKENKREFNSTTEKIEILSLHAFHIIHLTLNPNIFLPSTYFTTDSRSQAHRSANNTQVHLDIRYQL
jgi:hypothetical protein